MSLVSGHCEFIVQDSVVSACVWNRLPLEMLPFELREIPSSYSNCYVHDFIRFYYFCDAIVIDIIL